MTSLNDWLQLSALPNRREISTAIRTGGKESGEIGNIVAIAAIHHQESLDVVIIQLQIPEYVVQTKSVSPSIQPNSLMIDGHTYRVNTDSHR
jgi:hypothetical protein